MSITSGAAAAARVPSTPRAAAGGGAEPSRFPMDRPPRPAAARPERRLDRPVRLVVWGFAGTVVDSYGAIRQAADRALANHGLPRADEVILRSSIGLSLDRIFGRLVYHLPPDAALIASLVAAYRDAYRTAAPQRARLVPGIDALLADLDEHGIVSALASSEPRSGLELLLDRLDIAGRFAAVVCDEDVSRHHRTPHPEVVLRACRALGHEPADAVVIGDTVFDVEMGHGAGTATIGVTWGNQSRRDLAEGSPTHLVDDVDELGSLLRASTVGVLA